MLGRSLKSESLEGQSPEAKSRRVQQSYQIQEGQESSAECSETSNLRVPDPVQRGESPVLKVYRD